MVAPAVIERVRRLVALTSSPFLEEARTSAFMACELIRRHGLKLAETEDVRTASPDPERIPIKSRFPGYCAACGYHYSEGELVWWAKGARAWCSGCHRAKRGAA